MRPEKDADDARRCAKPGIDSESRRCDRPPSSEGRTGNADEEDENEGEEKELVETGWRDSAEFDVAGCAGDCVLNWRLSGYPGGPGGTD